MPETRLEQVPELREHHAALKALGYRTLEQFMGAAHAAGPALGSYLNTDVGRLLEKLPQHGRLRAAAAAFVAEGPRFSLGVRLERVVRSRRAFAISPPTTLVPQVNLIAQMPPILDQANRGTCVAHGALAVVEHYAGLQGAYQDMSEQFLYWDCKGNDGDPNGEGTWLGVALPLLQRDGCCFESTWPYNPNPIPGNEGEGPPPLGGQTWSRA